MARYLVHRESKQSAGWYPDGVARVLLSDGFNGWSEAEAPESAQGGLDVSLLNEDERKQHEAVQAGNVLTMADLYPEEVPQPNPEAADAAGLLKQSLDSLNDNTQPGGSADNEGN
jgi:hypothetical protein